MTIVNPGEKRRWASHPLILFYLLAFAISWVGFVPELAVMRGSSWFRSPAWLALLVLPGVGPAVAAWIAGRVEQDGERGVARVWKSLRLRVSWQWWLAAIAIPAGSFGAAFLLGGSGAVAVMPASWRGLAGALLFALAAYVWEEVGWRGFALARLQRRFPPLTEAAIVGILWALWHLPLLVIPQSLMSTYPVLLWAAGTMSHSVVLTWLFNRTGKSLGVVTVCHVSSNVFGALLGVKSWSALAAVELSVALGVILISHGRLGLVEAGSGRTHRRTIR